MVNLETLKRDIERQFIEKPDDWKRYLNEVNKSLKKFDPDINDSELYTYDELCQSILNHAVQITQEAEDNDKVLAPSDVLKAIYKNLILDKVDDANVAVVRKNLSPSN